MCGFVKAGIDLNARLEDKKLDDSLEEQFDAQNAEAIKKINQDSLGCLCGNGLDIGITCNECGRMVKI